MEKCQTGIHVTALADTKQRRPSCIPQTEGGGPEINTEGDDLARWNRFIVGREALINLLDLDGRDLRLASGSR